jgi:hypothetical protein
MKNKGTFIDNYRFNLLSGRSDYIKMKGKSSFYIKPELISRKLKNVGLNYYWEKNTNVIKKTNILDAYSEDQSIDENKRIERHLKEGVYLDRMKIESKYRSVYVDIDEYTGRIFVKEMPLNYKNIYLELNVRKYNLEKLMKFKKLNNDICRIKISKKDIPLP